MANQVTQLSKFIDVIRDAVRRGEAYKSDSEDSLLYFQSHSPIRLLHFRRACHEHGATELVSGVQVEDGNRDYMAVMHMPEWTYIDLMTLVHTRRDWRAWSRRVLEWAQVEAYPHNEFNLN